MILRSFPAATYLRIRACENRPSSSASLRCVLVDFDLGRTARFERSSSEFE